VDADAQARRLHDLPLARLVEVVHVAAHGDDAPAGGDLAVGLQRGDVAGVKDQIRRRKRFGERGMERFAVGEVRVGEGEDLQVLVRSRPSRRPRGDVFPYTILYIIQRLVLHGRNP
jgi:hypothetical protein